jgi:hypothetical protein
MPNRDCKNTVLSTVGNGHASETIQLRGGKKQHCAFIFCFIERKINGADNFSRYTTIWYPLELGVVDDFQDHLVPESWPWVQ